ncbi:hypothetical protein DFH27DRAFT_37771 [Peziza echinospora]|nr:hypothetical protein DFH27DRAFT_37771 [Peziza echinospora]
MPDSAIPQPQSPNPLNDRYQGPGVRKLQASSVMRGKISEDGLKVEKTPMRAVAIGKALGVTGGKMAIQRCKDKEKTIWASRRAYRMTKVRKLRRGKWPEVEEILHNQFLHERALGNAIGRKWFTREGRKIFKLLHPTLVFDFTGRWFEGFCRRWEISWESKTKVSQKAQKAQKARRISVSALCN